MIISAKLSLLFPAALPQTSEQGLRGRNGKYLVGEMPFTVCSISFVGILIFLKNTWITWCLGLPWTARVEQKDGIDSVMQIQ